VFVQVALLRKEFGVSLCIGFEIEFYLMERRTTPNADGHSGVQQSLPNAGDLLVPVDSTSYSDVQALHGVGGTFLLDLMTHAETRLGVDCMHGHSEGGPGQFEVRVLRAMRYDGLYFMVGIPRSATIPLSKGLGGLRCPSVQRHTSVLC
jgi:glutamine synthetase